MPGYRKSEEYWAILASKYVRQCGLTTTPAQALGEEVGMTAKAVATTVHRLKEKGFLVNGVSVRRPELTQKALDILAQARDREALTVVFDVNFEAKNKAEALAQAWDVVTQLESWDPRQGQFRFQPERLTRLGEKSNAEDD